MLQYLPEVSTMEQLSEDTAWAGQWKACTVQTYEDVYKKKDLNKICTSIQYLIINSCFSKNLNKADNKHAKLVK